MFYVHAEPGECPEALFCILLPFANGINRSLKKSANKFAAAMNLKSQFQNLQDSPQTRDSAEPKPHL